VRRRRCALGTRPPSPRLRLLRSHISFELVRSSCGGDRCAKPLPQSKSETSDLDWGREPSNDGLSKTTVKRDGARPGSTLVQPGAAESFQKILPLTLSERQLELSQRYQWNM
jgi:hypothetical protein